MQKRILVIEPVEDTRRLLEHIFETKNGNYQVITVPDSFRALDQLLQQPFELILMDEEVMGIGWLSLAQIIRSIWRDCRILLMVGNNPLVFETKKKPAAIDGLIAKPFSPTQLLNLVEQSVTETG